MRTATTPTTVTSKSSGDSNDNSIAVDNANLRDMAKGPGRGGTAEQCLKHVDDVGGAVPSV